jgi:hypothetical protein
MRSRLNTIWAGGNMIGFRDALASSDATGRFEFEDLQPGPWTLRAAWSPWMFVDQTVVLPLEGELEFVQPPSGSFAGQLLLPPGAPIGDADLWINPMLDGAFRTPRPNLSNMDDPSGLEADGSFQFGPIPVGEIDVSLRVMTEWLDKGRSSTGSGTSLGTFTITEGAPIMHVIDVRSTFPARVHGSVVVDGVAASSGLVTIRSVPPSSPQKFRGGLSVAGQSRYGGLVAGSEQRLDTPHRMVAVPPRSRPRQHNEHVAITTIERQSRSSTRYAATLPHQRRVAHGLISRRRRILPVN